MHSSENSLDTIKVESDNYLVNSSHPVLQINLDDFKKVAVILRGTDKTPDNCAYLAQHFIDYLRTGIIPSQPLPTKSPSLDHISIPWHSEKIVIKPESEQTNSNSPTMIESIYVADIVRNTVFGSYAPPGEIPQEINGIVDFTERAKYDVDYAHQNSVSFNELKAYLQMEAKTNGGVSFGLVSLAPCGEYVDQLWHLIVYYATPHEVVYIDCQENQNPVFDNLEERYAFL